jgi:hypothetical protein
MIFITRLQRVYHLFPEQLFKIFYFTNTTGVNLSSANGLYYFSMFNLINKYKNPGYEF